MNVIDYGQSNTPQPCRSCGHCPTCGRGGVVYPYTHQWYPTTYPYTPTLNPFWYSTTTNTLNLT